jgi:hypothetical protein
MQSTTAKQSSADKSAATGIWAAIRRETARAFTLYFEYCALVAESRARPLPRSTNR